MGPRKKSEDGEDGMQKTKKPNNFWAPFNTWWREHHERTGSRATVVEMREWYAQNAHTVWAPDMMPSVEDMLKIAKGLRTIKQVQAYFRSYRKNLKSRKEGDPASPDASNRRGGHRRHIPPMAPRPLGSSGPGGFFAAMQQAASSQHYQLHPHQPTAVVTGAPGYGAYCQHDPHAGAGAATRPMADPLQLPFQEWGFTTEAAAAEAMEAFEGAGSEGEGLSDAEETPGSLADDASAVVAAAAAAAAAAEYASSNSVGGAGTDALGAVPVLEQQYHHQQHQPHQQHPHLQQHQQHHGIAAALRPGTQPWLHCPETKAAGAGEAGAVPIQPSHPGWAPPVSGVPPGHHPHQPQHPHTATLPYLPPALPPSMTHRRIVKAIRTSVGGNCSAGVRHPDGSGGGAAAAAAVAAAQAAAFGGAAGGPPGMQAVTCRRTRVHTSAGGVWQQEVVEQLEVGMAPRSPGIPYGMQLPQPYSGLPGGGHEGANAGVQSGQSPVGYPPMDAPSQAAGPMVWHGRSTIGGGYDAAGGSGAPASANAGGPTCSSSSLPGTDASGAVHAPPRKQLRCGDRGVVSMGGGVIYDGAPSIAAEACTAVHSHPQPHGGAGCSAGGGPHQLHSGPPSAAGAPNGVADPAAAAGAQPGGAMSRRFVQSYGGTAGYPPSTSGSNGGLRHKPAHGASAMALSDGGGAMYGTQLQAGPSAHHPYPHALPPYRGPSNSYGGMPPAPGWSHPPVSHHPHAGPQPAPAHHHPPYPPYHSYGYRHPAYPPQPTSAYGYPPPAGYPGSYHMPVSYNPYGMPMHPYGQYGFHGMPDEGGRGTDSRPAGAPGPIGAPASDSMAAESARQQQHLQQHPHHHQQQQQALPPPQPHSQHRQHAASQPQQPASAGHAPGQDAPMSGPFGRPSSLQPLQLAELPACPLVIAGGGGGDAGALLGSSGAESLSNSDLAGLSGLSALDIAESDAEGDQEAASGSGREPQQPAEQLTQSTPGEAAASPRPAVGVGEAMNSDCRLTQGLQAHTGTAPAAEPAVTRADSPADGGVLGAHHPVKAEVLSGEVQEAMQPVGTEPGSEGCDAATAPGARQLEEDKQQLQQPAGDGACGEGGGDPAAAAAAVSMAGTNHACEMPAAELHPPGCTAGVTGPPRTYPDSAACAPPTLHLVHHHYHHVHHQLDPYRAPPMAGAALGPTPTASRPRCSGGGGLANGEEGPGPDEDGCDAAGDPMADLTVTFSDGGGTDGAASVYYKTPKLTLKPLSLLPHDDMFGGLPDSAPPSSSDSLHRHLHLADLLSAPGSFSAGAGMSGAAAAAALSHRSASGSAGGVGPDMAGGVFKTRGGSMSAPGIPTPVTIHVLQEEVVVLPHMAGPSLASLGDLTGLHSPTMSLNLSLLDTPGGNEAGNASMWRA